MIYRTLLLCSIFTLMACTLPAQSIRGPASTEPNQSQPPARSQDQVQVQDQPEHQPQVEEVPYTFRQPTQFFIADGILWVAQLNGGENQNQGQVVTVDLLTGEEAVQIEDLDKPTGIALIDDTLWIATRNELLKWSAAGEDTGPEAVLSDLPNNGRSNGTLTASPEGLLIFETSGNTRDADSGKLWAYDPDTGERTILAKGLKGGYAHTFDDEGRLWLTEIADGAVAGNTLPGEINMLTKSDFDNAAPGSAEQDNAEQIPDFGWPRCYGRELTGPDCSGVRAAVTALPIHSTPTGIAISPFSDRTILVALWVTGQVVEIPYTLVTDDAGHQNAVGDARVWLSGLSNPQHIEVAPDGSVWVSEFATGKIYRVTVDR